ncbi:MAG: hypothetical protein IT461_00715 [Planctomycetes bacterium]|jgi:hypothetical protein|nr:hypothetical protein [Planctomycetota bacterium]
MKSLLAVLLLLAASPVFAQADPVKAAQPLDPDNKDTKAAPDDKPPASSKSPVEAWEDGVGKVDTALGKVRIGGYATLLHKTVDKYNGGNSTNFFDSARVVPQLDWEVVDWLEFGIEIEFEGGGSGASYLSNNYIVLEYAEARATPLDELNFRAGILLINWGRYNRNHDDIFWDLADRPYVHRHIIPGTFMQPGFGIYGTFNQIPFVSINYDFAVTQGLNSNFTSNDGARNARTSFRVDNNDNKAMWFHLGVTPDFHTQLFNMDVGVSYTYQETSGDNGDALRGVGVDGAMKFKIIERFGIDITGEFSRMWINRESTLTVPNGLYAWHADILFKVDPFPAAWRNKVFGARPYIGLIFRIEQNDLNDDFKGAAANDDRFALTIGLAFRPISKLVVRLEWKNQQSRERDDGDENLWVASVSVGF